MSVDGPAPPPRVRPRLVWVIFLFYVVSSAATLASWLLIYAGKYPLPSAQLAALQGQSTLTMLLALANTLLCLAAATWLWLLQKRAFDLFVATFALGLATLAWNASNGGAPMTLLNQNTLALVTFIVGLVIGWGLRLAICMYVWRLRQRGVLQ